MSFDPSTPICGVDGCRGGWVAVHGEPAAPTLSVFPDFASLVGFLDPATIIAVDMPIGLPDRVSGSGRGPEQAIRPFLGPRQSSVFSIPARRAVEAKEYRDACEASLATSVPPRKVSKQAFYLFAKILEIDRCLRADERLHQRVIECHPEFGFCVFNDMRPMRTPKKIRGSVNPDGIAERIALLSSLGFAAGIFDARPPRGVAADDRVDAAVNLMIAARHRAGRTRPWPDPPGRDAHGIPIAIHG
jgi:predicted RNase H-like nuclease